jgi:hypothetical protein
MSALSLATSDIVSGVGCSADSSCDLNAPSCCSCTDRGTRRKSGMDLPPTGCCCCCVLALSVGMVALLLLWVAACSTQCGAAQE